MEIMYSTSGLRSEAKTEDTISSTKTYFEVLVKQELFLHHIVFQNG